MKTILNILIFSLFIGQALAKKPVRIEYYPSGEVRAKFYNVKKYNAVSATYYYENGNVEQKGYYLNGSKHGKWTQFDTDGKKIASALFIRGMRHGKWYRWDSAGGLQYIIHYREGETLTYSVWNDSKPTVYDVPSLQRENATNN